MFGIYNKIPHEISRSLLMSLKKHTTLAILLILASTLNAYAQSPFGDDIIVRDEKTKPVSLTSTAIQPPSKREPPHIFFQMRKLPQYLCNFAKNLLTRFI